MSAPSGMPLKSAKRSSWLVRRRAGSPSTGAAGRRSGPWGGPSPGCRAAARGRRGRSSPAHPCRARRAADRGRGCAGSAPASAPRCSFSSTDWYSAVGMFFRLSSSCVRVSTVLPACRCLFGHDDLPWSHVSRGRPGPSGLLVVCGRRRSTFFTSSAGGSASGRMPRLRRVRRTASLFVMCSREIAPRCGSAFSPGVEDRNLRCEVLRLENDRRGEIREGPTVGHSPVRLHRLG